VCLCLLESGLREEIVEGDFRELRQLVEYALALSIGVRLDNVLAARIVTIGFCLELQGVLELDLVAVPGFLVAGVLLFERRLIGVRHRPAAFSFMPIRFIAVSITICHVHNFNQLEQGNRVYKLLRARKGERNDFIRIGQSSRMPRSANDQEKLMLEIIQL
jgi:hypothetical protein